MGSWGKIGSEGSGGEVSVGKVGIGKGSIGEGSGIGSESSSGDDGSGLEACGWLGIREVGSKDLRCMDKGDCLADGMPGGLKGEGSGSGETELGWF